MILNKLFIRFLEQETSGSGIPWGQRSSPERQAYARRYWEKFVEFRQSSGLCLQCNRKHQPSMQRCGLHRRLNREKCYTWFLANKGRIKAKVEARKAAGVCVTALSHGPAERGHIYCSRCRRKSAQWRRNNK